MIHDFWRCPHHRSCLNGESMKLPFEMFQLFKFSHDIISKIRVKDTLVMINNNTYDINYGMKMTASTSLKLAKEILLKLKVNNLGNIAECEAK